MILVAGLSPAWQQIMRFAAVREGEVNRALDVHWCASGKVLNVAIALQHLGATATTIAPLGGAPGSQIRDEFAAIGIESRWITTEQPTRVCTTVLDRAAGRTTELVENAGVLTSDDLNRFRQQYLECAQHASLAVLTGSLPAGAPANLFRELLEATPCPALLDIRGPELIETLPCRPLVIKPNREELGRTVGRELKSNDELHDAMREMNRRGAQWVVISQGAAALWVAHAERLWKLTPPQVEEVNPIGSGDCLAAGVAWALSTGTAPLEALRIGVAAAAENVTQLLPARLNPTAILARAATVAIEAL